MWNLFRKDLWEHFDTLSAYMAITCFSLTGGLMLWVFPSTSVWEYGYADMAPFFGFMPYVFVLLIPALSMRSFAEEKRKNTLELLRSLPISNVHMLLAKYAAILVIAWGCLLLSVVYYLSLYQLANPVGNIDKAAIAGGYLSLCLLSSTYAAFGLLFSILCRHTLIAFILTTFLCIAAYMGLSPLEKVSEWHAYEWKKVSLMYPYEAMQTGFFQAQDLFFFVGLNICLMVLATQILAHRS